MIIFFVMKLGLNIYVKWKSGFVNILCESGRASRVVLEWLKNGIVVHDARYFLLIQQGGPEVEVIVIFTSLYFLSQLSSLPIVIYKYVRNKSGCSLIFRNP
jgi:hypothetical protein